MSTSTNASKGSPDDDEGRLSDDSAEPTTDEVIEDEAADTETDADDVDTADAEAVPATAAAIARTREAAERRSGGSQSAKKPAKRPAGRPAARTKKDESRGPIAAIVLFVRQVISELRKVVTPTGKELGTYVAVVIVFVLVVMAYIGVLDFAIGKLVLWAFGG